MIEWLIVWLAISVVIKVSPWENQAIQQGELKILAVVLFQSVHRSLQSMLDYTGDDFEEVFCQPFQISYTDLFGSTITKVGEYQGSDLQNNETKLSYHLIGWFSWIRGFTKGFCLPIGQLCLFSCFVVLLIRSLIIKGLRWIFSTIFLFSFWKFYVCN